MDNRSFFRGRTIFLTFIFLALIVIVLLRFFYLQVINGDELKELREKNINTFVSTFSVNGEIYVLLILLEEPQVAKNLVYDYVKKLRGHINFSEMDLELIKNNFNEQDLSDFITIKRNLSWNELEFFEFMKNKFLNAF